MTNTVGNRCNSSTEDFCFQLTSEEYEVLRCQFVASKTDTDTRVDNRGGRRYLPYVFTEQGISMLASVLHSEVAINVSISIMRAFVEMRRFLTEQILFIYANLFIEFFFF